MFLGFKKGETYPKMKKPSNNKFITSSWEGPFIFVEYLNANGYWIKMKEIRLMWWKARNNNFGTCLEKTCSCSILHHELWRLKHLIKIIIWEMLHLWRQFKVEVFFDLCGMSIIAMLVKFTNLSFIIPKRSWVVMCDDF